MSAGFVFGAPHFFLPYPPFSLLDYCAQCRLPAAEAANDDRVEVTM